MTGDAVIRHLSRQKRQRRLGSIEDYIGPCRVWVRLEQRARYAERSGGAGQHVAGREAARVGPDYQ